MTVFWVFFFYPPSSCEKKPLSEADQTLEELKRSESSRDQEPLQTIHWEAAEAGEGELWVLRCQTQNKEDLCTVSKSNDYPNHCY